MRIYEKSVSSVRPNPKFGAKVATIWKNEHFYRKLRVFNAFFVLNPDMVDTCQEKTDLRVLFFNRVSCSLVFQPYGRGGIKLTTVNHSDIRGLDTA
jgi:hypothetical protein